MMRYCPATMPQSYKAAYFTGAACFYKKTAAANATRNLRRLPLKTGFKDGALTNETKACPPAIVFRRKSLRNVTISFSPESAGKKPGKSEKFRKNGSHPGIRRVQTLFSSGNATGCIVLPLVFPYVPVWHIALSPKEGSACRL